MRLYELTDAYQQIIDRISTGEEGLEDTLESIEEALEVKLENTAKVVRTIEAEAKALKEEEDRLKKRRQHLENQAKRLKQYAEDTMNATGLDKVKGLHVTLRIQNNPPSVNLLDETQIPAHYLIEQQPAIDKKGILEDLKNGIHVDGAEIKQTRSLRIK